MVKHSILLFSFLIFGCKAEMLSIINEPYIGSQLRIDGYYYSLVGNGKDILIFYRNGVLISPSGYDDNISLKAIELDLVSDKFISNIKKNKSFWSYFKITNKDIEYETWEPTSSKDYIYSNYGIILNDTTFINTKIKNRDNKEFSRNDTFKFKQFLVKPDSTNSFL